MNSQLISTRAKTTMVFALPQSSRSAETKDAAAMTGRRFRKLAWVAVVVILAGAGGYFRFQYLASAEIASPAQAEARRVNVTTPQRGEGGEIVLPATVQAYQATDLFARASGYLKAWHFDIGERVKAGQVLAEIETPELDQELAQAVAFLKQGEAEHQQAIAELEEAKSEVTLAEANIVKAKANHDFSLSQAERYQVLAASQTISREEHENAVRDRDARKAALDSTHAELRRRKTNLTTRQAIIESKAAVVGNRQANVQRLRDLTGFQRIVAPFDGVVTRRSAEVGMLVTSGSNAGTRPLYSVAQTDTLRVQASVPQSSALGIKEGDAAVVTIPERPGQQLNAKVARTAGAVEPASRSLLVEVELPNRDGLIPPGIYAQVRFQSAKDQARWVIESKALLMRSNGPHVAVVNKDGAVRIQKVVLGRDFGSTVEVLVGLNGSEQLVVNPTDDLRDGAAVQVADNSDSRRIARN